MRGPYDFLEGGKRVPRYFEIDGQTYTTIEDLRRAATNLPAGSRLLWSPGCIPYDFVELGPQPYMTVAAFRLFCRQHRVEFVAHFGGTSE